MRKKTCKNIVSTIFWWTMYALPIIMYLFYVWGSSRNIVVTGEELAYIPFDMFSAFVEGYFPFVEGNLIFETLLAIFGPEGTFPLIYEPGFLFLFSWFIGMNLVHICVDVILFIPRFCHKLIDTYAYDS